MAPVVKKEAKKAPASRSWDALKPALSPWILDAVSTMGFEKMTPVQASTIPLFMGHKDVVVEAVTGSGKTLSFLIPVVERLLRLDEPIKKHHVGAIIISPTRELASQIHSVLLSLLQFHGPSAAALNLQRELLKEPTSDDDDTDAPAPAEPAYPSSTLKVLPQLLLGGTTTPAQDLSTFLKTAPNLLIATPGRLLELLSSPHVHCPTSSFECLVLDEADRLLDLGFQATLQSILSRLPKQRRTGLFSASVSEAVGSLIRVGLRNPVRIAVKVKSPSTGALDRVVPASLSLTYLTTPPHHKLPTLAKLFHALPSLPQKSIIYLSTCAAVDYFQHTLPLFLPSTISLVPLHGKHPPQVRTKNFARFVDSASPVVLLTTDVAARGLDVPQVDLVIQLDPPTDPKAFLHRCGRAGRAGRKGLAILFLHTGREEEFVHFLQVRNTPVAPLHLPGSPDLRVTDAEAAAATERMRAVVRADRAVHDKAQRAFVSWVQAYRKHEARSIFRVEELRWAELGRGWGLLMLPRMPEAKGWEGDRTLGVSMDWEGFAYRDPKQEAKRRAEMEEKRRAREAGELVGSGSRGVKRKSEAWSRKKEEKSLKEVRREKKKKRMAFQRWEKMPEEERKKQEELEGLIRQARKKVALAEEEGEWEGFED